MTQRHTPRHHHQQAEAACVPDGTEGLREVTLCAWRDQGAAEPCKPRQIIAALCRRSGAAASIMRTLWSSPRTPTHSHDPHPRTLIHMGFAPSSSISTLNLYPQSLPSVSTLNLCPDPHGLCSFQLNLYLNPPPSLSQSCTHPVPGE